MVYIKKPSLKVKRRCDLKNFDSDSEILDTNRPAGDEK